MVDAPGARVGGLASASLKTATKGRGMRIPLNLAREPFRHNRQILVASALCLPADRKRLALRFLSTTERCESAMLQAMPNRVNRQIANLRGEQAQLDTQNAPAWK